MLDSEFALSEGIGGLKRKMETIYEEVRQHETQKFPHLFQAGCIMKTSSKDIEWK
jgi:hypothetical protein